MRDLRANADANDPEGRYNVASGIDADTVVEGRNKALVVVETPNWPATYGP